MNKNNIFFEYKINVIVNINKGEKIETCCGIVSALNFNDAVQKIVDYYGNEAIEDLLLSWTGEASNVYEFHTEKDHILSNLFTFNITPGSYDPFPQNE